MRNFLTHKLSCKPLHMNNGFIVKSCIFWFKVSEKKLHFGSIWDIECILYMFKHSHHSRWPDKHIVRQIIATATLFVMYCITKACLFRNNRSFMMKFGGITSIGVGLFHVLCYHVVTCIHDLYNFWKRIGTLLCQSVSICLLIKKFPWNHAFCENASK